MPGGRSQLVRTTLVSSFDLDSMKTRVVLNETKVKPINEHHAPPEHNERCATYDRIRTILSMAALGCLSWYLYTVDTPACAVPAATAIALLSRALFSVQAAGLIMLSLACACLCLLVAGSDHSSVRKFVSHEMMIWALYSFQFLAGSWMISLALFSEEGYWMDWMEENPQVPFAALIVVIATAVLLNHPILQIIAVAFSSIGFLSLLLVFAGLSLLLVPVVLLSLALGLYRAGTLLQTHRVHIIVFIRRCFIHSCRNCSRVHTRPQRSR